MAGSRVNLGNGAPRGSSSKTSKGGAMKKSKGGAIKKSKGGAMMKPAGMKDGGAPESTGPRKGFVRPPRGAGRVGAPKFKANSGAIKKSKGGALMKKKKPMGG